jgi:hypothetical protein
MPSAPCWAIVAALYAALAWVADIETAAVAAGLTAAFAVPVWVFLLAQPGPSGRARLVNIARVIRPG